MESNRLTMSSRRPSTPQNQSGARPPRLVKSSSSLSLTKEAGVPKRRHDSRHRRPNAATTPGIVSRVEYVLS